MPSRPLKRYRDCNNVTLHFPNYKLSTILEFFPLLMSCYSTSRRISCVLSFFGYVCLIEKLITCIVLLTTNFKLLPQRVRCLFSLKAEVPKLFQCIM